MYATARKVESLDGFKHADIRKLQLDVTSDERVDEVVKTIVDNESRIDIVVNNAGANCGGA